MKNYIKHISGSFLMTFIAIPFLSQAQLRVTTAGDVGINTATPNIVGVGKALTIVAAGNNRGLLELKSSTPSLIPSPSTVGGIRFFNATNESAVLDVLVGSSVTTGQFRFYTRNAAGSNGERMRIDQDGKVGIGRTAAYTLDVNGTANCNAGAWVSDQQFKTNVDSLQDALGIIKQLKPRTYFFDTMNVHGFNFPSKKQYGFLAQDLETVLPDLITSATKVAVTDSAGAVLYPALEYKAVYYLELIGILTKGIQELNATVETQQGLVEELRNQVASCCSSQQSMGTINSNNVNTIGGVGSVSGNGISDALHSDSPVLFQNVPNPFTEQTRIEYFIPSKFQSSSIMIFDLNGKLMETLPVFSSGKGSITINGNKLNPGMFVYSLIIDGKIIDTKRMILTK